VKEARKYYEKFTKFKAAGSGQYQPQSGTRKLTIASQSREKAIQWWTEEEIQRKEEALVCAWMLFLQHTGHIQAHQACTTGSTRAEPMRRKAS